MALGSKEPIVGEWNSGWHQHSAQQGNKDWGLRVMTTCKTRYPHWRDRHLSPISKPLRFNVCYQRQSHSSKWQNCIREPLKLTPPPNTHTHTPTAKTHPSCQETRGQLLSRKHHSLSDFLFSVAIWEAICKHHHCPHQLDKRYVGSTERQMGTEKSK